MTSLSKRARALTTMLPVIAAFLMGLALAAWSYRCAQHQEQKQIQKQFQLLAQEQAFLVKGALNTSLSALETLRAFSQEELDISRKRFTKLAERIISQNICLEEVSLSKYVPHQNRQAYERQLQEEGLPEYLIKEKKEQGVMVPAQERAYYYPNYYIVPFCGNEPAAGFDLISEPVLREAVEHARATGSNIVTSRIPMTRPRPEGIAYGVVALLPLQPGTNNTDFITGAFYLEDIIKKALRPMCHLPIQMSIYDRSAPAAASFLLTSYQQNISFNPQPLLRGTPVYRTSIKVASREWEIICKMTPEFVAAQQTTYPIIIFSFSILITVAICFILFKSARENELIRDTVQEQTKSIQQTETKLDLILQSIPDFVLLLDQEKNIIWSNESTAKFFNMDPTKHNCERCPLNREDNTCLRQVAQELEPGQKEVEFLIDGRKYIFLATTVCVDDHDAFSAYKYVQVFHDVTHRKADEAKVKHAARVKSEFTSMVSHELRTPLTAMLESVSLVLDGTCGPLNEEQQDYLEITRHSIARLARLINDVLHFQKLDSELVTYKRKSNDLNHCIKSIVNEQALLAKRNGIVLTTDIDESLPLIEFDMDSILQVLNNLINNAMKFTEKGSITLQTSRDGAYAQVMVADTGIGIPEKELKHIFKSFVQVDGGITRQTGSSGLGLSISEKIIQQHCGKLWVESELGNGSQFYFTLPLPYDVAAKTPG